MLSLLLAAALTPTADASAFYFVDTGTKGLSRVGAFVAGADDLTAQHYNPAALINVDGPQVFFDFSAFHQSVSFTRKDYDPDTGELLNTWDEVSNSASPMLIPALGFGHDFGLDNAYFAIGVWTPVAPSLSFPAKGAQHYSLTDSLTWQIWGGPSAAYRFFDVVTIGGGIAWTLVRAEESLSMMVCQDPDPFSGTVEACTPEYAENAPPAENNDVNSSVKAWDKASLTGNVGILIEPTDWLKIGASAIPPLNVKAKGTLDMSLEEDHWLLGKSGFDILASGDATDEEVTVLLTMPWVLRYGVAVNPTPDVQIELAGGFQGWSATKEIRVTDINLVLPDNPDNALVEGDQVITDDVVLPAGYKDSWSVRLAGDADVTDYLSLRGGVFYETSAVPTSALNVALVDGDKFGFGLGGSGIIAGRFAIDIGFVQSFLGTQEVTDSDVHRLDSPVDFTMALEGAPLTIVNGEVVGNGTYKSSTTMGSLGLTYMFGKRGDTAVE